jgi:site-specific DNA recombinase
VSTDNQAEHGTSLDVQAEAIERYARENGCSLVENIADEGISGARLRRAGLNRLRGLVQRREVEVVIVTDLDRLSRQLEDQLMLVREFKEAGCEVIFINMPLEESPMGQLLFGMRGLFHQFERSAISARTWSGKEQRAREGKVMAMPHPAYGYRYIIGEGRLELVEEEAYWVREVFDWFVEEHASVISIARKLNDLQVPTKQGGLYWRPGNIRNMLRNTIYTGAWQWNRTQSAMPKHPRKLDRARLKSGSAAKSSSQWIEVQVPAVITPAQHLAAAERLASNKHVTEGRSRYPYLLRGLLRCHYCGYRIVGASSGPYAYYKCGSKTNRLIKSDCPAAMPRAERLEKLVWDRIVERLSDRSLIEEALCYTEEAQGAARGSLESQVEEIQALVENLREEKARLVWAVQKKIMDPEDVADNLQEIKQRMTGFEAQLAGIESRRAAQLEFAASREAVQDLYASIDRVIVGLPSAPYEERRRFLETFNIEGTLYADKLVLYGLITGQTGEAITLSEDLVYQTHHRGDVPFEGCGGAGA